MEYRPVAANVSVILVALLLAPALLPPAAGDPEPDDTFALAVLIDSDSASLSGSVSINDYADMYKIMLNRTGSSVEAVNATLTKTSEGGLIKLYIYDADGYRLSGNATVGGTPIEVASCAPFTAYVYIAVLSSSNTVDEYILNVTKTYLVPAAGLLDSNNRPSEAVAVAGGYSATGYADSFYDPQDFYSVPLDAGSGWADTLTVQLSVPASADLAIEVFKMGNSSSLANTDGGDIFNPDFGVDEVLYFVPAEPGTYAFRIWAEHGAGDYDLSLRLFRGWRDSDNDLANATELWQDGSVLGNVSLVLDQDDYYKMLLRLDTRVNITLTVDDYDPAFRLPNINLYLLDPTLVFVNSSTAQDPVEAVGHNVTVAGWYYIKVSTGRDSAGSYTLAVNTVQPPVVLRPEVNLTIEEDGSVLYPLQDIFQDPAGRPLTYRYSPAEHLLLAIRVNQGNVSDAELSIEPVADWNGHAGIDINATNVDGKVSWATVNLTVTSLNDPPVAEQAGLSFTIEEDQPFILPVSLFSLFSDVDGDALRYSVRDAKNLTVNIDGNGTLTAVPAPDWWGSVRFFIVATDPANATAEVAVTLEVSPKNDRPVVAGIPGNITFPEHGNATLELGALFADPDGDPLGYSAMGNLLLGVTISGATAVVRAQDPHWFGTETVTFLATDPSNLTAGLSVNFTVTMVNDPPYVWRNLPNQSIREDTQTTLFNLNSYFKDPHNDPLNFTVTGFGVVWVNISADGWVTFSSPANWSGADTMTFFAEDPAGVRASLMFNLTVEPVDDSPQLSDPKVSPGKGDTSTVFTFSVVVRDIDSAGMSVTLVVGQRSIVMERVAGNLAAGATYRVKTALPVGTNTYYFAADDGQRNSVTSSQELRVGEKGQDNTLIYISLLILIIIVVALALAFSPTRGRERPEDEEE